MKKAIVFIFMMSLCIMLAACSQTTVVKNLPNKIESTAEARELESCIAELEEQVSREYRLDGFRLIRLKVDIAKNDKRECVLLVEGIHKENGVTAMWNELFEISYDDYLLLSGVNNSHVVYNVELNEVNDPIISDVPSWVIVGVNRIMFG
ncbi:MAG: hypothetical protein E7620_06570 [Ruminococcaceae bacterium]|nr:hypothetical protein [Oscillospiraceae bacterium]